MTNSLDPDQDRLFVGPDLDSSCLQVFSSQLLQFFYNFCVVIFTAQAVPAKTIVSVLSVLPYIFACWVIFYAFVIICWLFQNKLFPKKNSGTLSESNGLHLDYQQTTKVAASKERVNKYLTISCLTIYVWLWKQSRSIIFSTLLVCLFVLSLYVPSQQLWSWRDGQLI